MLAGFAVGSILLVAGCGVGHGGQTGRRGPGGGGGGAGGSVRTVLLRPTAPVRSLPPGFLGFNAEALTASSNVWSDPRFVAAVARLHPGTLRIFGGTTANYWDWRRGTFVSGADVPPELAAARDRVHLPLAVWMRLFSRTGARALFDLNVVTSSLPDQLALLRAARRLGLPIERVELGNELYLPRYAREFPTGAAYGRLAAHWIKAIKRRFPGVLVAVSAYLPQDVPGLRATPRERSWNSGLRTTAHGADAMAFHPYFRSNLGAPLAPRAGRAAATVLAAPGQRFAAIRASVLGQLGPGIAAWMTEWNLFDRQAPVHGTWSQGLAVAAFGLNLLSDRRITQADNHALVASAPFASIFADTNGLSFGPLPASSGRRPGGQGSGRDSVTQVGGFIVPDHPPPSTARFGLSASGVAMSELLSAVRGSDRAQLLAPVPASPNSGSASPLLPGGAAAQQGVLLSGPGRWTLLLVNLDRRAVAVRALGGTPPGGSYEQLNARPEAPVAGPWSLQRRHGRVPASGTLVLAPYSLTRVWGR